MSAVLKPNDASLRPMEEADLEQVIAIEKRAYDYPWTLGIFHDCLQVGYCCWVLGQGDDIEAYGVMSVGAGESHILNLCVRPDRQGRGLGKRMLEHMLAVARRYKAEMMFLEVRPSNRTALDLYFAAGFNEIGTRKAYYPTRRGREDALILALDLSDGKTGTVF